ncbi:helix-turn-helix domain-containing protein [Rhizomonospora bruguierae]|uniref:helix-turn-helix domain-containing protein n=1 Tax=Rhizomonospora bruguierae TaxID=1581705 RepID=UPI0020BDE474
MANGGERVTTEAGSTVPRRQLGRYLRELRQESGITLEQAGVALEWSVQKLWRLESGAGSRPIRKLDVQAMCQLYGASTEMAEVLTGLAAETQARGWWHAYGESIPPWFELYVGLETAASRLRKYDPELVPGLLHTEAYTREILAIEEPHLSPPEVEAKVRLKRDRQRLLTRTTPPAPKLDIVISETVLRRPLSDREAMAEQLRHMMRVAQTEAVDLRVLPHSAGLHRAAVAGGFCILDFPRNGRRSEPTTVHSDKPTGSLYLDKPTEVSTYEAIWADLLTRSLDPRESLIFISKITEEYLTS